VEKRLLLASALSLAVLFAYSIFFGVKPLPPEAQNGQTAPLPSASQDAGNADKHPANAVLEKDNPTADSNVPALNVLKPEVSLPSVDIPHVITDKDTEVFHANFDNRSGTLSKLVFQSFVNTVGEPLIAIDVPDGHLANTGALDITRLSLQGGEDAAVTFVQNNWEIIDEAYSWVSFRNITPEGLSVIKTFGLTDDLDIEIRCSFTNTATTPLSIAYTLTGGTGIVYESEALDTERGYNGTIGGIKKGGKWDVKHKPLGKIKKESLHYSKYPISWVAASSQYFIAILAPEDPSWTISATVEAVDFPVHEASSGKKIGEQTLRPKITSRDLIMEPGETLIHDYVLYVGPKSAKYLEERHEAFLQVIDYGFFNSIAQFLLVVLNMIFAVVRNYGVAIILVTLAMRLALHPLTNKQYRSMQAMQKLAPKIKELKAKFKNDKQKEGQAIMELYRKEKINPLAGCLPLFLQFPVFLAMFRLLGQAFELRQAHFFLWINDLSAPDRLFGLPFTLPLLGNNFNLLPLLMTATWVIQQKTMPKPQDAENAAQQKMLAFMPIIFGFLLYNYASGLSLYWLTSTVFGIIEQKLIKRKLAKT